MDKTAVKGNELRNASSNTNGGETVRTFHRRRNAKGRVAGNNNRLAPAESRTVPGSSAGRIPESPVGVKIVPYC